MKYRAPRATKTALFLFIICSICFLAACGDDPGDNAELDASDGYLAVIAEPPPEVISAAPFSVKVGIVDDTGEAIALDGIEISAALNQGEFSADAPVMTTDSEGMAEFEFTIEMAASDYAIEFIADDQDLVKPSVTTELFDVVAADADADNTTITADEVGVADGVTPLTVTIELVDAYGNPVVGITPAFEASGQDNQYGDCSTSDADGRATCEMTTTATGEKTLELTEPIAITGDTVEFVACLEAGEPFGGGDGSSESPHRICAPEHLNLSQVEEDIGGDSFLLTSDIDLADVDNFAPLGLEDSEERFSGTIDGGGFAVKNITIDRPDSNSVSFMGSIGEEAQIRDLTLENIDITGKEHVSALTVTNYGTITNTHIIDGTIRADGRSGAFVATNEGTIADSSTSANIINEGSLTGGIAGNNTGTISGSHATGDVEGTRRTGGLVGSNSGFEGGAGIIEDSYATGAVIGGEFTGGLVGWNDGEVHNSYAAGDISGEDRSGGLVGRHNSEALISHSFAQGDVTGLGWVGGLVGLSYGAISTSYSTANVDGEGVTGGLVGRLYEASVTDSYAAGSVESSGTYVGALIGSNWDSSVSNSYWDEDTTVVGASDGGSARSTAQFGEVDTFEGWDFDEDWTIGEAPDGETRPILQWQE